MLLMSTTIFLCGAIAGITRSDDAETVCLVYQHNMEVLKTFSCTFHVTTGTAKSRDEAFAGNVSKARTRPGTWKMLDGSGIYTLECADDDASADRRKLTSEDADDAIRSSDRGKFLAQDCTADIEVVSAVHDIRATYDRNLRVVNLHSDGRWSAVFTPLSMGIMGAGFEFSPLAFMEGASKGTHTLSYVASEDLSGSEVDVLEGTIAEGPLSAGRWRWHMDIAKGGLPVLIQLLDGQGRERGEARAVEIKRLSNGAWIVQKSVLISERAGTFRSTMIDIDDITLDPPNASELQFTTKPGDRVINVSDMRSSVIADEGDFVHVDNLPEWIDRCAGRLKERLVEYEADEKFKNAPPANSGGIFLVVAIAATVGGAILWFARRKT